MRSPIKWVGGKSRLARSIVAVIPPHACYAEVFGGAGWVLFSKAPSKVEVLNDIDGELVNFFRVVRDRPRELIRRFEWCLVSREEFDWLCIQNPDGLSELERAYRFFYLIMASWGGEHGFVRFQTSIHDGGGGNRLIGALRNVKPRLLAAHDRLQGVIVEHMDWRRCLAKYDSPDTFFYVDPPYPGNSCNYKENMRGVEEHEELLDALKLVKARWILSSYDKPEFHSNWADFHVRPVSFASGMPSGGRKNNEVLVANFCFPLP